MLGCLFSFYLLRQMRTDIQNSFFVRKGIQNYLILTKSGSDDEIPDEKLSKIVGVSNVFL